VFRKDEWTFVLVAKECAGLVAPVASHDMRVSERGIGDEITSRSFLLASDQVVASQNPARCFSNDLPAHDT
jgi:hypothetical protein